MEDGPNLLQVSKESRGKRSIGLEGLVFFIVINTAGQGRGAGNHLLVNGGILGVLFPKGRVIILVLGDELMSNNVDRGDTRRTPKAGQNGLYPFQFP